MAEPAPPPLQPPPGQPSVLTLLRRSFARGTVHHAYLFDGPDGVGKGAMARWFAGLLLCAEPSGGGDDLAPCSACPTCTQLARGHHPDLEVLEPPPDRKGILIAQVRELIRKVSFAPLSAQRRVVLVAPADRMDEAPANALLKTLEEPARYNHFVLVTSRANALLDTIRSRSQRVRFHSLDRQTLVSALCDDGLSPEQARVLAAASGGSLGAARSLSALDFCPQAETWLDAWLTPGSEHARGPVEALAEAEGLAGAFRKDSDPATSELVLLLRALGLGIRDALLAGTGAPVESWTWPERAAEARELHRMVGTGRLMALHDRVRRAGEVLTRPVNPRLVLEDLLLRLDSAVHR